MAQQSKTQQPADQAAIEPAEPWQAWETWLCAGSVAIGVAALTTLGVLVHLYLL